MPNTNESLTKTRMQETGPTEGSTLAAFKAHTPQLCEHCGQYGRASIKIYFRTEKENIFLCNSVICVYCRSWVTMYTGSPSSPDFSCRSTRLPRGYSLSDLQKAMMARPACRVFTIEDLSKAKYGRLF